MANLALAIVVAQSVSQEDAGVFFSATSLFLVVASVVQLGTNTGLVYFISGSRARGELASSNAYMRAAVRPVMAASVVMGGALFALAEPLGELLSPGRESEFERYAQVMAFFLPCAAVLNLGLSGTRGLGTMTANASIDQVARPAIQFGLVVLALALDGSTQLASYWTVAYLPLGIAAWISWRRLRDGASPLQEPATEPVDRAFWSFTLPRALAGVAQVAIQRLDIVLVGALAGLAEAAIYTAATRFLVLGQTAARAVSMSVQPLLGEALADPDGDDARELYQASTGWLVLITWPIYLVLIGFGPTILDVFGEGYAQDGGRALTILSAAMLVATACGMVDMVLTMAGRSLLNLTNVLVAFGVYLAVDFALITRLGLVGAAIGWAAGILTANLLPLAQVRLAIGLHPFGRATITAMAVSAAAFGAIPTAFRFLWSDSVAVLVPSVVVSVAVYALVVRRLSDVLAVDVLIGALRRRQRPGATVDADESATDSGKAPCGDWTDRPPTGPRAD